MGKKTEKLIQFGFLYFDNFIEVFGKVSGIVTILWPIEQ
jgi:hypothetical protein